MRAFIQSFRAFLRRRSLGPLLAGILLPSAAVSTEVVPWSMAETLRQADAVVLGTVTSRQSRWGDASQRWIETDFTFALEEFIHEGTEPGALGDSVVLTFWGGTLDGETQAIADLRYPSVNEQLVLMLRPGWQEGGFTPVAGFNHGLFAVVPDRPGGPALIRDYAGENLALTKTGQVVRRKDIGMQPIAGQWVDLSAFRDWVQDNIAAIKSQPSEVAAPLDANDPRVLQTFSATPEVSTSADTPAITTQPASAVAPQSSSGSSAAAPAPSRIARSSRGEVSVTEAPQRFSSQHQARLPIVVNQFTPAFTPWSPEDQYQMSKWNYYANEVFRVLANPTGTFGWPNNQFDLAGWPSSADLLQVYGDTWESNGFIAVTFTRIDSAGWIIESDIAFNPAYSYTLDDEWIYNGSSAQGFRLIMLHELGHMHGLRHNFNDLSVMNYLPPSYRAFGLPYMDDAAGIRAEYPGAAVSRTDLGVYLYRPTGFQSASAASMPLTVVAGANLTVSNYQIENVGTTTIDTPTIEWYLTAERNYSAGYFYLGTSTYSPSLSPFTHFLPSTVARTFTVPENVAPGEYYLGAFIRDDGGAQQPSFPFGNNNAFSRSKILITSAAPDRPPNDDWINASGLYSTPTSATGSNIGATTEVAEQEVEPAGSTVWWVVQPSASGTLTIDTFGSNFDTMLHIYTDWQNGLGSFTPVASNDDAGGTLQSQVTFAVNASQFYEIRVAGFASAEGDITLNVGPVITGGPAIKIAPLELSISVGELPPSPVGGGSTSQPSPAKLVGMLASPHDILEYQPDGTPVKLNIRGGPSFHWLEDKAGFTVLQDRGSFVYARLDSRGRLAPTKLLVGKANPAGEGLVPRTLPSRQVVEQMSQERQFGAPAATAPTAVSPFGNIKNVVILMRFANHVGRTVPSSGDFDTIFNAVGGDPVLAPTGSVRDYYLENSYGMMVLNSTVYSWVTLPQTEQYYADGTSGLNPRIHQAITSALNLADPLIDFGQYDGDDDGYVDSIAFVHSGYGAEWGGSDADGTNYNNRIWSHRWSIPTWISAEGVSVSDYHINPSLWSTSGSAPGRIGVIVHETGHFLGLPDLYDSDYEGRGIGAWGVMGDSWGFTLTQLNPPHFSAWSKSVLGWVTPTLLTASGNYIVDQSETHPQIYKITAGFPKDEYLLIENRQPYGFDSTMPEGGLAIWHIDETIPNNSAEGFPGQPGWPGNSRHYKVALLQADGEFDLERGHNVGDARDLYRGTGVSEISDATLPNTKTYQNGFVVNTGNRVHAISASGPTMTFSYEFSGTTGSGFEITNDGTSNLIVSSITKETSAPWISWTPLTPFNVAPGATQFVQVTINPAETPGISSTTRLLVESNDPDKNPYPGGVLINVTKLPVVSILASDDSAGEPGRGLGDGVFTFSRTGSTAEELTVNFTVAGPASSGLDFLPIGTSVAFPAGSATVNKILVVIQDDQEEGDETVDVTLASGSGYLVGSPDSASVTISDALMEEIIFADDFE